eukprot:TRINITY_DN53958_c0_g1_i1.p1 TRINITY_DN53958_c0_g1~~TRINITY_DN53958_c0_g1_i1.p1  ORF type:complete len:460 (+),score=121.99 TRINITY_DN53958_c0_g1_i1:128-1507(+)
MTAQPVLLAQAWMTLEPNDTDGMPEGFLENHVARELSRCMLEEVEWPAYSAAVAQQAQAYMEPVSTLSVADQAAHDRLTAPALAAAQASFASALAMASYSAEMRSRRLPYEHLRNSPSLAAVSVGGLSVSPDGSIAAPPDVLETAVSKQLAEAVMSGIADETFAALSAELCALPSPDEEVPLRPPACKPRTAAASPCGGDERSSAWSPTESTAAPDSSNPPAAPSRASSPSSIAGSVHSMVSSGLLGRPLETVDEEAWRRNISLEALLRGEGGSCALDPEIVMQASDEACPRDLEETARPKLQALHATQTTMLPSSPERTDHRIEGLEGLPATTGENATPRELGYCTLTNDCLSVHSFNASAAGGVSWCEGSADAKADAAMLPPTLHKQVAEDLLLDGLCIDVDGAGRLTWGQLVSRPPAIPAATKAPMAEKLGEKPADVDEVAQEVVLDAVLFTSAAS